MAHGFVCGTCVRTQTHALPPQDRTASPVPLLHRYSLFPVTCSEVPAP
ncbi:hypothetical protein BJP36_35820 [Moorena producens JHB]|uniref:Uncharacterized protein n=1 Tax=Moorena producens (strain JHB) TaxID=1454205 RepID=A0A9Q9STR8_MOOP1|nr:hypothetical protein [Moorena producens]WAN69461.1 hypothetical protein BJP36_35820 [Moorena producens JHB]